MTKYPEGPTRELRELLDKAAKYMKHDYYCHAPPCVCGMIEVRDKVDELLKVYKGITQKGDDA